MSAVLKTPASADDSTVAKEFKEFVYIISHDLRAPLRAITEFSKILQDEQGTRLDEEGQLYLKLVNESGLKLQAMLEGLLEYSRLSTVDAPRSDFESGPMVEQAIESLRKQISASGGSVRIEGKLPVIHVNPKQFTRLVSVLIDNALKFTREGYPPQVSISVQKKEDAWVYSVKDNGIGIEKEYYERVFQPFRKLHNDEAYLGVGMGLTVAKKIVELHNGSLWIDSEIGQGSVFSFSIPAFKG